MTNSNKHIPDHEVLQPLSQRYPVVFNSPHSGENYRADFIASSRLKALELRTSEDSYVDQLFSLMVELGCPLLKANFPRAFLDVNRGPWELDPKMFADPLPSYVESKTLRVFSGLGTIARNVSENAEIYLEKLNFEEARARIERYYFPYHQALRNLVDATRDQFGEVLLIDCHSMPSSAANLIKTRGSKPDIILGDRHGSTCHRELIDQLEYHFQAAGLNIVRNKPYAGGYITQTYGQPRDGVHVIQIEINRGLYMNEKTIEKTEGFEFLEQTLGTVFASFMQTAPRISGQGRLAAE